ncbi:MAG: hypothetical protein ACK56Q_16470 [Pirellulaceae bacterium]
MTRNSSRNELWIDADWLLGRRMTPRTSNRRSWGLLAAAVILFCIGPAMQAVKQPPRREGTKSSIQMLPSASLEGPIRISKYSGLLSDPLESTRETVITSISDTDPALEFAFAGDPADGARSSDLSFSTPYARDVAALPAEALKDHFDGARDDFSSMGTSEPTWSPTAFWHTTCKTSWGESPWGLRPDAWVIPAVSISEGMQ